VTRRVRATSFTSLSLAKWQPLEVSEWIKEVIKVQLVEDFSSVGISIIMQYCNTSSWSPQRLVWMPGFNWPWSTSLQCPSVGSVRKLALVHPKKSIVTCWVGNTSNNLWILDLMPALLVITSGRTTINYYNGSLTVSLLKSSLAHLLYSSAAASPNSLSSLRASCRVTNIHRYGIHYFEIQLNTVFMLARTNNLHCRT
jgi:hypothetical protein